MSDIFLSYAHQDRKRVTPLVAALQARGWDVWWDDGNIPAGQNYTKLIGDQLRKTRCVVVLWSKYAVESEWVLREAHEGDKGKKLIPALLDPLDSLPLKEIPFPYGQLHTDSLVTWSGRLPNAEFDRLVKSIEVLLGASVTAASAVSAPAASPPPVQRSPRPEPVSPPLTSPQQPGRSPAPESTAQGLHWLGLEIPLGWPHLALALLVAAGAGWIIYQQASQGKTDPAKTPPGVADNRSPEAQEKKTAPPTPQIVDPNVQGVTPEKKQEPRVSTQAVAPGGEPKREPPASPPGTIRENPKDGLRYVYIPAGKFQMGCSPGDTECDEDEKPAHEVTLTKGYWLGQTEVTQGAYRKVTGKSPSNFKGDDRPVERVSWDEAVGYCTTVGLRLPTEAEWEYAARAGTTGARYGALDQVAWYDKNSGGGTKPVASKQPNAWGLYDMLGNVWEWTADYWAGKYPVGAAVDPQGPASGTERFVRGGAWDNSPRDLRASYRYGGEPSGRYDDRGFRCGGGPFF